MSNYIKSILDARRVIEFYGFKINRAGFISCPFHSEKTASLKVYSGTKGWNCYGCGQNGSVVDFVMKLFGLNYHQAIVRLSHDFRLNITKERPDARHLNEMRRKKKEQERLEYINKLIDEYKALEFRKYYYQFHDNKPAKKFEELSEEFIEALLVLPELEEWVVREWK